MAQLELRAEEIGVALRRDLRGGDDPAAAHVIVKRPALENKVLSQLLAVDHKGIGDAADVVPLKIILRQIGRGVGHDGKAHRFPPWNRVDAFRVWHQYSHAGGEKQTTAGKSALHLRESGVERAGEELYFP